MRTLKDIKKGILKSSAVRRAACWIAAQYIRIVWRTGRWEILGREHIDTLYAADKTCIVGLWHGRLLMLSYAWQQPSPFHMLISSHRDGELIANTVRHLGISWIKGSTGQEKGGARALRTIVRTLKSGEYVGVTPDGPRGPRMRASAGIVNIARLADVPILPLTYGVRTGRVLGTWDRFLLPAPFTKGVMMWGPPITVPRNASPEQLDGVRSQLETELNAMTADVDRMTGREPVRPAEAEWGSLA